MKENTQEKSLIAINENSIFYKIKKFFKNLFSKNKDVNIDYSSVKVPTMINDENKKKSFVEEIKNIETEETKLLKLQTQYRNGEIKEEDLTEEQVSSLCKLYDTQIANLKKSNEIRKQKLAEYRRRLHTNS